MPHYYCKTMDILVKAKSKKEAVEYAQHRLSPAYGYGPGAADSLSLKKVKDADVNFLMAYAIYWEA